MEPLLDKIKNTLTRHQMLAPGNRVLIGISGGPDSVALFRCMHDLKEDLHIELVLGHLNHCARGEESERDARFVRQLGETFNTQTFIEAIDVPAEQTLSKSSFQETARNIRLEYMDQLMRQTGADKIALGHTANDQAETVLMNFLRGSGPKGLAGMQPVRQPYIRPLFDCTRAEVMEYLNNNQIDFCVDASNDKKDYLRNRVRLELIPFLRDNYNPEITENLFETASIFQEENEWMNSLAAKEFERSVTSGESGEALEIAIETFQPLPLALKRRLARKCLESVKGDLRKITFRHVQSVLRLVHESQKGKQIDLPGCIQVSCMGDRVLFKRIPALDSSIVNTVDCELSAAEGPLNVPGQTWIERSEVTLEARILDAVSVEMYSAETHQAYLDYDKIGGEIRVRFFQPGDRIEPLGMAGTKKVKSIFIDEKVPQEKRSFIPILTTVENDIIWVYGTRISHSYRVTADTKKVLFIKGLS